MQEIENEILPKDDLMFKAIYGSSGSENILKSFISSVLKIKIKNLHYTTKEIINRPNKGKHNCLDVLVELDNGENRTGLLHFRNRMITEGNPASQTLNKVLGKEQAVTFFQQYVMPLEKGV